MACSCVSDIKSINSGRGINGIALPFELDDVPLTERRKLLQASKGNPNSSDRNSGIVEDERGKALMPSIDTVVKKEHGDCDLQGVPSVIVAQQLAEEQYPDSHDLKEVTSEAGCGRIAEDSAVCRCLEIGSSAPNGDVIHVGCNWQETQSCLCPSLQQITCLTIPTDADGPAKTSVNVSSLPQCPVKIENSGILLNAVENDRKASPGTGFPSLEVTKEIPDDTDDDLDHLVLKVRQKMLVARKMAGLSNPAFEGGDGGLQGNIMLHSAERVKEETHSAFGKMFAARDKCNDILEGNNTSLFQLPPVTTVGSSMSTDYASLKSTESSVDLHENYVFKSTGMTMQANSHEELGVVPVKNNDLCSSAFPISVKIKDEPWDNSEHHNLKVDAVGNLSFDFLHVKSELEVHNEYYDDQVEHMCLRDRLKFLMLGEGYNLNISASLKNSRPTALEESTIFPQYAEPLSIKHPRKRKKTATDSIQTALEEDAPGLLQVLINKGVSVEEIKLYGAMETDEDLDESFCEDSFSELEAVISKIFSHRHSFLKFASIRATKASRASYCLACLISLVEQTRYLQFRKWPVEWGWCRDLQSFIFVFERHNRIVLERPEYGYATYFFELVESLPIVWQIKRLVTAMKLTSCSRISLIENKSLSVGEDLTEGEARVLMEYGWTPNSGLGTMLNYCDRVVHDRKNEKDSSEWRSKIGKLLMDGYNGGTIVTPNIPKKVVEYRCAQSPNLSCNLNI